MTAGVSVLFGVLIGTMVAAWRARRTAARAAAGEAVFFRVGANLPDKGRRYSLGRVQTASEFRWMPRHSWTRLRELPTGLRYVRTRETTFRESMRLPTGTLVIECESSAGPVRLWARKEQEVQVVEMLRRACTPDLSSTLVPDTGS